VEREDDMERPRLAAARNTGNSSERHHHEHDRAWLEDNGAVKSGANAVSVVCSARSRSVTNCPASALQSCRQMRVSGEERRVWVSD
jgi:hypothetical protein